MDDNTHMDTEVKTTTPQVVVQRNSALAIPMAIVFGFALIAVAIFVSGQNAQKAVPAVNPKDAIEQASGQIGKTGPVRKVDEKDHIRGNPNAPIVIVEYSDLECPFCKNFHETMNKVMENYGTNGKVAWVYRHFPLEQLHPNAPKLAQASECIAELGGNEAFWKFTDKVFNERGVNEQTDQKKVPDFVKAAGVDTKAYDACMADGHTKKLVEQDFADGVNAGAKGTPYSLVLVGGQQGVINGAQKYEYVSNVLDTLLKQVDGTAKAK